MADWFGKKKSVEDHFQQVKRDAQAHEMTMGKPVIPVLLTTTLTKAERRHIKHPQTPWCKVQIESGTRIIAYCHFERCIDGEDETLKTFRKAQNEKGVLLCFYRGDGSPFPSSDNQMICEAEELTPAILEGPAGMDIAKEIVIRLMRPQGANNG